LDRRYRPVLLANAQALAAAKTEVRATVEGQPWVRQAVPDQASLSWLRREPQALDALARARVDRSLAGTGCECLFAER